MKPRILSTARLSLPLATAIAALLAAQAAQAATYYWDNDGTTAGFGIATGTWAVPTTGSATQGWSTSATGELVPGSVTTAAADTVNFGNGATGLATGSITVSGVNTGNITFATGSGAITLTGGTISLASGSSITAFNTGGIINSAIALNGAGTIAYGIGSAAVGSLTVGGQISGGTGMTFTTSSFNSGNNLQTILLNSANTYGGDTLITTVTLGNTMTVKAGIANALPTGTVLTINGGTGSGSAGRTLTYDLGGFSQTLAGLQNTTGLIRRNQRVTSTTAATLTINNTLPFTFGGTASDGTVTTTSQITGAIALTKQGAGTFTLTGAAHTYTGATTVNGGTLDLGGSASAGSLASTVFNLGGGTFSYTRTGNTTQGFTTTNVNAGAAQLSVVSGNILNLGTVARAAGGTLDFGSVGAGTVAALAASNDATGIMAGLTFGDTWAVANGAGVAISGLAGGSYTLTSAAGTDAALYLGNMEVDNSAGALSGPITANSLRFNTAAANTVTLTGTTNTLTAGGILINSVVGSNLSTITGGTLAGANTKDLTIIQNNPSGGLTISSIIDNNTGATGLAKSGAGLLTLDANNTFTGGLFVNGGQVLLTNPGALNSTAGSENAVTFAGNSTGILTLNGNSLVIRSLTGSASSVSAIVENATGGNVTLTIGNTLNLASTFGGTIQDGTGGGTLDLTKAGTNTLILSGTNTYSGSTNISTGTLQIGAGSTTGTLGSGAVTNTATLVFNRTNTYTLAAGNLITGAGAVNLANSGVVTAAVDNQFNTTGALNFGLAAATTTVSSLDLTNGSSTFGSMVVRTNSSANNTITIASGKTLQLNGAVTVGYNSSANTTTNLTATGLGTLSIGTSVAPTNANFQIGAGTTSNVSNAGTLDLSGLGTFYTNLGTGTFRVGSTLNSAGQATGGSTAILAGNSTIQATNLIVAARDAGQTQTLKLGNGTNLINANSILIAGAENADSDGRSSGQLIFKDSVNGTLQINGLGGSGTRANMSVAFSSMNSSAVHTGLFDSKGHTATLNLDTLIVGKRNTVGGSATPQVQGQFDFDTGTLDVNNLEVGFLQSTGSGAGSATGTVNLSGGTTTINNTADATRIGVSKLAKTGTGTLNISGTANVTVAAPGGTSIRLGDATVLGGTANGSLNITGGTLTVAGDIIRGATTGTSNATVKISGGTLDMGGNDIGAAGLGAVALTAESGTLSNVASINGTGGLTKTTVGTLTLTGTNNYSGDTTVSDGTLAISGTGTIDNTPRIQINSSTTLDVTGLTGTTFALGAAQTLAGGGTVLATGKTVSLAGTLAPGSSPGTITQDGGTMQLAVGGDYNWQILDAGTAAGVGYDTTNLINGATIDLSLLSAGNTYNINLWSLSGIGPDVNGDATFNNTLAYSWTLFSTGTTITGFSTNKFTINTSALNGTNGFTNDLGGGAFSVGLGDGGTDLVLNFAPIPEPRAALLGGLGLLALLRRRR